MLTSVVMAFLASHHPVLFLDIALYFNSQRDRGWRTFKRPGVEAFLEQLAQHYELVIYSDQLSYVSLPLPILTCSTALPQQLMMDINHFFYDQSI